MKLIGSKASPYVRRIRIMLGGKSKDFENIDVFSPKGQERLLEFGPLRRVPILIDGDKTLFDSYLITEYLSGEKFSQDLKQRLFMVNEANDSGIHLLQFKRFGLDESWENNLSKSHQKRITDVLNIFNDRYENDKLKEEFEIEQQWLYCLLDWLEFREIIVWKDNHQHLTSFYNIHKDKDILKQTDPRSVNL